MLSRRPPLAAGSGATERSRVVRDSVDGVVGEDVVDLVAAAARGEAPDVGPLAVALLEVALGLAGVDLLLLVRVAVLGEAEVDERAMHRVA